MMGSAPEPEHVTARIPFLAIGAIEVGWCDPWLNMIEGAVKVRKRRIKEAQDAETPT